MQESARNLATETPAPVAGRRPADTAGGMHLAYVMSRFPKLTETFVLYEIVALDEAGVPVDIWPLLRERQSVAHPPSSTAASTTKSGRGLPCSRASGWPSPAPAASRRK